MDSATILSRNHDLHMHSLDYSDGSHPAADVVRYAVRWQESPRWAGLSDHSPGTDGLLRMYIRGVSGVKQKLLKEDGITLLTGMELEWGDDGIAAGALSLGELDYILAGYHGMNFTSPRQVEGYFDLITRHPYTDIAAHPDWFLGNVQPSTVRWEEVFNTFKSRGVLCEYNLTTPLHPDILNIAMTKTAVEFTIGSDTHYFHNIAYCRIINAWSESVGGGYEASREYLLDLLRIKNSQEKADRMARCFDTRQRLEIFQKKIFRLTLRQKTERSTLDPQEESVIKTLESIPEGVLDRDFQVRRFERFSALPPERIVSLYGLEHFKVKIAAGRRLRSM